MSSAVCESTAVGQAGEIETWKQVRTGRERTREDIVHQNKLRPSIHSTRECDASFLTTRQGHTFLADFLQRYDINVCIKNSQFYILFHLHLPGSQGRAAAHSSSR